MSFRKPFINNQFLRQGPKNMKNRLFVRNVMCDNNNNNNKKPLIINNALLYLYA